ncbi:MAG TPA: hypothetical protein VM689_10820 [Aliidongia sp.]|nr:hypothetical protein [Aliidongia sp.]
MGKARALTLIALLAPIAVATANASAIPLPDAFASVVIPTFRDAGAPGLTASGSQYGGDFYSAESLGLPSNLLSVSASSGPAFPPVVAAESFATLTYWFDIDGPPGVSVPILIKGSITGSATGDGSVSGLLAIGPGVEPPQGTGPATIIAGLCIDPAGCSNFPMTPSVPPGGGSFVVSETFASDTQIGISESVTADIMANSTAALSLNEFLEIDPAFPLADEFSISTSAGVNVMPPASSVPLPGSLSLFAGGLLALSAVTLLGRRARAYSISPSNAP